MFKSNQLFLPRNYFFCFFTNVTLFVCFWCEATQLRYVRSAELIIVVIFLKLIHFTRIWKIQEKILNSTLQLLMQSLKFKKSTSRDVPFLSLPLPFRKCLFLSDVFT